MRCDLVASLSHSPPLLFLDEPTIGRGKILFDGTLEKLRGCVPLERRLVVDGVAGEVVLDIPGVRLTTCEGNRLSLHFDPDRITPASTRSGACEQPTLRCSGCGF